MGIRRSECPALSHQLCPCSTHPHGVAAVVVRQSAGTAPARTYPPLTRAPNGGGRSAVPVSSGVVYERQDDDQAR